MPAFVSVNHKDFAHTQTPGKLVPIRAHCEEATRTLRPAQPRGDSHARPVPGAKRGRVPCRKSHPGQARGQGTWEVAMKRMAGACMLLAVLGGCTNFRQD